MLQAVQNNISEQDFLKVYNKYIQLLLKVAHDNLYDKSFKLDCVQDTFLGLIPRFNMFSSLNENQQRKYLVTICKRCAVKINSSNKKFPETGFEEEFIDKISLDDFQFDEFKLRDIVIIIKSLDEKYREPLFMKYVEEMSISEISQQLSISESNVKQRLFRGRKMIIEELEAYCCQNKARGSLLKNLLNYAIMQKQMML